MENTTFFYQSPVGILELRSNGTALTHLLFVNSWKGSPLDENQITFTAPSDAVLLQCSNELNEYFAGTRKVFTVPVQQEGTPFQLNVWNALCSIPYAQTISYMELSKRIGNVKAIRAVGTANGSNHVSIIFPCHRVIGSNGTLVGYGGDLWRKKWLLDHENKFGNGVMELF